MPPKQGSQKKKPPRPIGDVNDPHGFGVRVGEYLEWLKTRNFSERTTLNNRNSLRVFVEWCGARSLMRPEQITKPMLERYQRYLYLLKRADGRPQLSFRSQMVRLVSVRGFFKWLVKQNFLPSNPASELELPRLPARLPRDVLNIDEVERVLERPEIKTAAGLRDRAILEVLYSTGVRRSELAKLRVSDVDAERGTIFIREGKGKRDRMIPIGERALAWVNRYLEEVRPELVMPPDSGMLFLTSNGEPLLPGFLSQRVRNYVLEAELGKSGSCHLFRHTMATLMLEGGADIRHIQEMLGHQSLESTEIYTRVSIRKLKAIHSTTHPGAKLKKASGGE